MAKLVLSNIYRTILAVAETEKTLTEKRPVVYGLVTDYQPSLKELLGHEGGYTNDPKDPGGPTNWGITIDDAKMYWRVDATAADVKAMPLDVAKNIYKAKYWDAVRGDELPAGVDYCVFDYGVNSGIHRAIPLLQRIVGVTVDGKMGLETITATIRACSTQEGRDAVINHYQNDRLVFLQSLGTWSHFGKGWGTRVREVRALALKMSAGVTTPPKAQTPPTDSWHPMPGTPHTIPTAPQVEPAPKPVGMLAILLTIVKAVFGIK